MKLDWGVDSATIAEASRIQVVERLPHHLLPTAFQTGYVPRHLLLWAICFAVRNDADRFRRPSLLQFCGRGDGAGWHRFCVGWLVSIAPLTAASVLRFYWFRMSDILVPAGGAIVVLQFLLQQRAEKRKLVRWSYTALVLISVFDLWNQALHFPWLPKTWNPVASRRQIHGSIPIGATPANGPLITRRQGPFSSHPEVPTRSSGIPGAMKRPRGRICRRMREVCSTGIVGWTTYMGFMACAICRRNMGAICPH